MKKTIQKSVNTSVEIFFIISFTKVQILINTFFDTRGDPIVYNPKMLLNVLWGLILEALVINNFVLEKNKHLRLKAEFENFRRRKAEEISQLLQFEGNEYVQSLMDQQGFYKGNGCSACSDTGFTGRSSVNELLVCDEAIREAVMQKKASREIQTLSVEAGMRTLWDSGLQMVVDRKTTLEETLQKVAADQV